MTQLAAEMAFEIGDVVYFRADPHVPGVMPYGMIVAERCVQECHGGVQRMYRLWGCSMKLMDPCPEVCLTKEMPPLDTSCYLADGIATRKADRAIREAEVQAVSE